MTTIDKPMVPKIPDPPLGVSREILGDPCGGDGGGGEEGMLGAWKEDRRGESRSKKARGQLGAWKEDRRGEPRSNMARGRRMGDRDSGHAHHAAEEPVVWKRNPSDGTWRRSGGEPQPGPVSLAQGGLWRPWVPQEEEEETLQTITTVSIANPDNFNHPVHYASTDIRTRSQVQRGK